MIKRFMILLLAALACHQLLFAAGPATVIHDTPLYAEPFTDASQIGQLSSDTAVQIEKRKGGWYQIQTNSGTGWVRLTTLRLQRRSKAANNESGNVLNNPGSGNSLFSTGRASNSDVTAATGIRGLDDESVNTAANRSPANQLLDRIAVPASQATDFARQAHLQAHPLAYPDKIKVEPPPPAGEAKKKPDQTPTGQDETDDF